jgi:hypothetical protein
MIVREPGSDFLPPRPDPRLTSLKKRYHFATDSEYRAYLEGCASCGSAGGAELLELFDRHCRKANR